MNTVWVVTSNGEVHEGQILTDDELDFIQNLHENLNSQGGVSYQTKSSANYIAKFLLENYKLTKRKDSEDDSIEVKTNEVENSTQTNLEA